MKAQASLCLDMELIHDTDCDADLDYALSDTTYRQDGVTIGVDYVRLEGTTLSRGQVEPQQLQICDDVILGRGAFSTVRAATWKKRDPKNSQMDQRVAVKKFSLMDASVERRKMLLHEVKALSSSTLDPVSEPWLVQMYGAYLQSDEITIVLELLDRGSLDKLLHRTGKLSVSAIGPLSYQIWAGLARLHQRQILHRDLKPGNILLNSKGNVKLCDFGMAALGEGGLGEPSLMSCTVLGTSKFMAPERLRAQPYGKPSDVWSVGLVLWECLTGQHPFHSVSSLVDLVVTVEETDLEKELLASKWPVGIREMIVASLKKEPAKRIPPHILLNSPWYPDECQILNNQDAVQQMKQFLDAAAL